MVSTLASFDSQHEDMIHDVQMDYYGRRMATCSSDKTIRIFEIEGDTHKLVEVLKGHDGPVWQVSWGHPKFGNLLASCSYDGKVIIWKENTSISSANNQISSNSNSAWTILKEHRAHDASVNSVSWAPHEYGLILACASSDGKVSILQLKSDGQWESVSIVAHSIGCNAVTWAPATSSILTSTNIPSSSQNLNQPQLKRFATAGCDNLIKIWKYEEDNTWGLAKELKGHSDWVRDVAWAQSISLPASMIASCSQDHTVFIWKQDSPDGEWRPKQLDKFGDVVWRVSWSVTAALLAVSSGDGKVTLFKETLEGEWEKISELQESTTSQKTN